MRRQGRERDGGVSPAAPDDAPSPRTLSRRQALGRMSVVATAGTAAWVVPEIMTAKPAAGASLSLSPGALSLTPDGGVDAPPAVTTPTGTTSGDAPATIPSGSLAFTGVDIQRDAEIGAALIAGGWAMHHWASRTPKAAAKGAGGTGPPRSTDTPT